MKQKNTHTFKEGEEKLDKILINRGNMSHWELRKSLIEWGNSLILQASEKESDEVDLMPLPEPPPEPEKPTFYSFGGSAVEHYPL